jgi:phytanoyl-CoA hydroxylase
MPMQLSSAQLEAYDRDGYVVVEDLLSASEVDALRERIRDYTHGGRSWDEIKVQIEPRVQRGELTVAHVGDGIRKIDGLVQSDDLFNKLGMHENIVGIVEQIVGPDIKMFRNSLLLKPPEVGSVKGMHQDSPYWPIEPMSLVSCWFTLDDATVENGTMAVIPGAHKQGALPHVSVTDDYVVEESYYDMADTVVTPIRAGGGLFFHSLLPHYTGPNLSNKWRRAIALSYMSAQSYYTGEGESPVYVPVKGKTYPGRVQ